MPETKRDKNDKVSEMTYAVETPVSEAPETKKPKVAMKKSKPVESKKTDKPKEKKVNAPPPPPAPVGPLISFDRWFRGKGFKSHWKPAMQAYTNTAGRRTTQTWDQLFKNY